MPVAHRNLYATEEQLRPDAAYMEKHGQAVQPALFIDASMRAIAVSWLVEVACEYGLHQETLFLAIALLDRFLTHSKVPYHLSQNALATGNSRCESGYLFAHIISWHAPCRRCRGATCSWSAWRACSWRPSTRKCALMQPPCLLTSS